MDKRERRALILIDVIGVENEDENADEFVQASFDNRERFWPNYDMCDKKFRRDARGCEGIDRNLESIKMKILYFQMRNDSRNLPGVGEESKVDFLLS